METPLWIIAGCMLLWVAWGVVVTTVSAIRWLVFKLRR
jgi:hypothetical protein